MSSINKSCLHPGGNFSRLEDLALMNGQKKSYLVFDSIKVMQSGTNASCVF